MKSPSQDQLNAMDMAVEAAVRLDVAGKTLDTNLHSLKSVAPSPAPRPGTGLERLFEMHGFIPICMHIGIFA
ncbi:MAG: hypothetical protein AB7W37_15675 [Syntrophobacteraceae bacterium]